MDYLATIQPTITVSASPDYSSGDCVGGIITVTGAKPTGKFSELKTLTLRDAAGQGPALTLLFFRVTPVGGTYTDNAALVLAAADVTNLVGVVSILAADWYTIGGKSFVTIGDIGQIHNATAADLFLLIVAGSAYNAAATTDLAAELSYLIRS